jgi:CRP/FNR family transcriptional regulator, cyclic AMP receptor protein
MPHESLPKLLSQIDLFAGVPDNVIADLVAVGVRFEEPPGATLIAQGSTSAGLHIVIEGTAEIEVNGVKRAELGSGAYFGEISVLDGKGRSATVLAGRDGLKTFAISPMNLSGLIDKYPSLAKSLMAVLCARIRSLEAKSPD